VAGEWVPRYLGSRVARYLGSRVARYLGSRVARYLGSRVARFRLTCGDAVAMMEVVSDCYYLML